MVIPFSDLFDSQDSAHFVARETIRIGGGLIQKGSIIPKQDPSALGIPFEQLSSYKFDVQIEDSVTKEDDEEETVSIYTITRLI